ncbi:hypothetical protein SAMN05216404_108125 [Nitrosospira multiformis]|uniref:Uncharacterized protein n=1 Tax=Nitrosospira multiformis TaxID=1231 RepID=A0A1H8KEW0_9PROT|nr:hypothetical protein [Nitrosospira multiformis]SEN91523.1 hypothetical protein SAMN05216404_108125 [Nitrosospira multiformis]
MTNWLECARRELSANAKSPAQISKSAGDCTDNTDKRVLSSVLSVPQPGKSKNLGTSSVDIASTLPPAFQENHSSARAAPPMSDEEEALLGAWLTQIGETDPEGIAALMNKCRLDMDARRYFVKRARGELCLVNSSMDAYLNEALAKWKLREE